MGVSAMNVTDLSVVLGLGAALSALLLAVVGRRNFLLHAVNPHRMTWLLAAVSVLWVGFTLMRWEARSWDLVTWSRLAGQLVTDEPAPARVKVASLAILFSLLMAGILAWCVSILPLDPSTFRRPQDRRAAFRYYVARLRGGLDFAVLALGDGEQPEEATNLRQLGAWCPHLPKVKSGDGPPHVRDAQEQIDRWRRLAAQINAQIKNLDALIEPGQQGRNRRLVFDAEFGGIFFRYLRQPDPRDPLDTGLYLFGATLNQMEMSNGRAERQFQLLFEALRHIERSVRVA